MMLRTEIPPGSLVRLSDDAKIRYPRNSPTYETRAQGVGILIGFDLWGHINPDKGDPIVQWAGEKSPARMAGSLVIVSS